jgi:hypothetical protein
MRSTLRGARLYRSSAVSAFSTNSGSFQATGLTVTMTAHGLGLPVKVEIVPDGTATASYFGLQIIPDATSSTYAYAQIRIQRGGTTIGLFDLADQITANNTASFSTPFYVPVSVISLIDFPSAGSQTYTVDLVVVTPSASTTFAILNRSILQAYEMVV